MKLKLAAVISATLMAVIATPAFAAPDIYVVNFKKDGDQASQTLAPQLRAGISLSGVNAEEVIIDTSTGAKWEKGAHEAFDRGIVPVFNQWVGLPGFAAIVDANSKQIIGCVNAKFSATEIASEIRNMAAATQGRAYISRTSFQAKTTACPAPHNKIP